MDDYYTRYYIHQIGSGGSDDQFLQVRIPRVYQRGRGVGGIFSSIWRFIQPLLKSGATHLTKELIETGSDILKGVGDNKPIKSILADRSVKIVDKLRDHAAEKIRNMAGAGKKRQYIKRKNSNDINRVQTNHIAQLVGYKHPLRKRKKQNNKKSKKLQTTRVIDIFS